MEILSGSSKWFVCVSVLFFPVLLVYTEDNRLSLFLQKRTTGSDHKLEEAQDSIYN